MNSCNPVFVTVGLRLGVDRYYRYFEQFGLKKKTGIDLPGEAGTIMHKKENMGPVELATVSFGQSFQITPIQLATTVSSLINGGKRITPHFGLKTIDQEGKVTHTFTWPVEKGIVSEDTSSRMREILFQVVENGGGQNGKVEGYRIGAKRRPARRCPEGRENTFPLSSVLRRRRIRKSSRCASSVTRRESITADKWRRR